MKQEMMGWQWHELNHVEIFASCYRHTTTPAAHHSIFYKLDTLLQGTAGKNLDQLI